ncbi:hypothetical protein Halhy_6447 [Haliscomenobacter hydrossis DSM 1100]|uniref:TfoX N-terminal domain-containing protein n=1 Tax=Haliscomenobacter hydrossis (strain ATCC 27775 / DSM 1100 / LMG 10767 / O) TaxID=760192 RepID=F4KR78_HALH1|nr:hypothetical protein Halhy_6447 [Haliscomenobacter hydrossis DSM 1100]
MLKRDMDKIINSQRIADALTLKGIKFEEKKMFGGFCFMVDDKMLVRLLLLSLEQLHRIIQ